MGHQGWTRNRREGSKQGENDKGPPGGASGKESTCPRRRCKRHRFNPRLRKISWKRKWLLTPVFLPGESHEQRSWWGCKELDTTEHTHTHTHTHTHISSLQDSGSQPELHIRITWETLKTQMQRSYPKPVTSGSLRLRSKPQKFLKFPRKFQCAAEVENNSAGGYTYYTFSNQFWSGFASPPITFAFNSLMECVQRQSGFPNLSNLNIS